MDQQKQKNVPQTNGRTFFDLGRVPGNFLDYGWYLFFVSLFTSHYSIPSSTQVTLCISHSDTHPSLLQMNNDGALAEYGSQEWVDDYANHQETKFQLSESQKGNQRLRKSNQKLRRDNYNLLKTIQNLRNQLALAQNLTNQLAQQHAKQPRLWMIKMDIVDSVNTERPVIVVTRAVDEYHARARFLSDNVTNEVEIMSSLNNHFGWEGILQSKRFKYMGRNGKGQSSASLTGAFHNALVLPFDGNMYITALPH